MYPALADTLALLFYFAFWWLILMMLNGMLMALTYLRSFDWALDALVAVGLAFITVVVSKWGTSS